MRMHFQAAVFGFAIVTMGIAVGAVWEMLEWAVITVHDPVPDLIVDTVGAIIAGIFGARILAVAKR